MRLDNIYGIITLDLLRAPANDLEKRIMLAFFTESFFFYKSFTVK